MSRPAAPRASAGAAGPPGQADGDLTNWEIQPRLGELRLSRRRVVMKRLWIVPFGLVFAAMIWLVIATLPDIKRYIRMHEM